MCEHRLTMVITNPEQGDLRIKSMEETWITPRIEVCSECGAFRIWSLIKNSWSPWWTPSKLQRDVKRWTGF